MNYLSAAIILGIVGLLLFWKKDLLKRRRSKDPEVVLMRAQSRAGKIIQEAIERARTMELEASYVGQDFKDELKKNLHDLLEETEDEFRDEYAVAVRKTLLDLSKAHSKEAEELREELQKDVISSQKELDKKIDRQWEKVKSEIEDYKKEQIEIVKEKIDREVTRLAQEILGKAIRTSEHEKLVLEALEEAKEKGVFEGV